MKTPSLGEGEKFSLVFLEYCLWNLIFGKESRCSFEVSTSVTFNSIESFELRK